MRKRRTCGNRDCPEPFCMEPEPDADRCRIRNVKVCLGAASFDGACVLCLRAEAREKHRRGDITAAELGAVLSATSGEQR